MTDELLISGKNFISSKKAATVTGYAQDYIGQLARGGLIEAQRVGGLWYVNLESLTGYKTHAATFVPQPPSVSPAQDPESMISFDGKDYVSASRASKITGYNQDYIGQLARSGKVLSRQIGNRWYVDRAGLIGHKAEKDSLLAAVQSESVGLGRVAEGSKRAVNAASEQSPISGEYATSGPVLTYFSDDRELLPLSKKNNDAFVPERFSYTPSVSAKTMHSPLRVESGQKIQKKVAYTAVSAPEIRRSTPRKRVYPVTKAFAALTIVIVLSYGLVSLKDSGIYASITPKNIGNVTQNSYAAAASEAVDRVGAFLESFLTKDLSYKRTEK